MKRYTAYCPEFDPIYESDCGEFVKHADLAQLAGRVKAAAKVARENNDMALAAELSAIAEEMSK